MAQRTELEISRREVMGKAVKRLRKVGIIPANVFGHNEAPMAIQIDALAFERLRRSHGTRSVLTLRMPGKKSTQTALIRHIQREPHTGKIIHVDFFRVSLSERIRVKVPLRFIGEAPAVKTENGVLLHLLEAIEVECVARDIPEYLEVDVSGLTEIDAILHASDVKLSANFTLVTDPEEGIVKIAATRAEVAEEAAEAAAAASEAAPAAAETAPTAGSTEA
ncbi:MAG TPA: 50S ribosomal protein L25 [Ktedonobacteraceae bacterium]|nr:50S ribosomal protein L25 [Ktedonobacteraceae bacterium]